MINVIDLFAGAGGLAEGFKMTDTNIIAHVESNKDAADTLLLREIFYYLKKQNKLSLYYEYMENIISYEELIKDLPESLFEKVLNIEISENTLTNIFSLIDKNLGTQKINGIIGGPPCQAYSTIGRARNEKIKNNDPRIYLYKHYLKFLEKYQPDFFVFENVRGLKSYKDINGNFLIEQIEDSFNKVIRPGFYNVTMNIINSADYGVPQNRERLFIFGYKRSMKNFDFFQVLKEYLEKPITIKELFCDLPKLNNGQTINNYSNAAPVPFVSKYIRKGAVPLSQNIARKNQQRDLEIYKIVANFKQQKNINIKYYELPDNLRTHKNSHGFLDRFKALSFNNVSHTIVAHIAKDGHYYIHPDVEQNRSITLREAARIQTFPDDYYFLNSRTASFVQIGNAVPPYLSYKISMTIVNNLY